MLEQRYLWREIFLSELYLQLYRSKTLSFLCYIPRGNMQETCGLPLHSPGCWPPVLQWSEDRELFKSYGLVGEIFVPLSPAEPVVLPQLSGNSL